MLSSMEILALDSAINLLDHKMTKVSVYQVRFKVRFCLTL